MFRIWGKVQTGDKITKSTVIEGDKFVSSRFFFYVVEICEKLDIPTPAILKPHVARFTKFNNVKFRPSDFVETVDFNFLVLENLPAEK